MSRKIQLFSSSSNIFETLFLHAPYSFWLDSSHREQGLARFSFLGAADGPESYRIESSVANGTRLVCANGETDEVDLDVFSFLDQLLASSSVQADPALPFDFRGGFVGSFGYELMAVTEQVQGHESALADAMLLFVDRFVAVDHETGEIYLVALHRGDAAAAEAWCDDVEDLLRTSVDLKCPLDVSVQLLHPKDVEPFLLHDKAAYLRLIALAKQKILEGESYEICLTNRVRVPIVANTPENIFEAYLALRKINPAPYACLLRFDRTSVLCSSPERFLKISPDGVVESKPIKGTMRRGANTEEDESNRLHLLTDKKFFSENLMIVDLLRNDLTRSCIPGSVHVPALMQVESYATVHQLVSTIQGVLEQAPVRCVASCFPGGSMTGAPKRRTLEIIDDLEGAPRGIYSGAIGYLSLNGAVDLNVVIRTVVIHDAVAEIGVGGAIIHLSDAEEEYEEILLKALAPFSAIASLSERE